VSKKTIKKENSKRQREKDVIGLALIVMSVFFLLCMSIPVVLGAVSGGVRNFAIGSFGYLAFPMFICLAVYGVILIQDRTLGVKKKTALQVLGITLLGIFLLTLATSHSQFTAYGFSDYLTSVYNYHTAGGAFFGIFAYAIGAAITPYAAYVVLSLGMALIVLIMVKNRYFPKGGAKKISSKVKGEQRVVKKPHDFGAGQTSTQTAKVHSQPSSRLYVDNILPTASSIALEENSFSEMKPNIKDTERQHSFLLKDEEFLAYKNSAQTIEIDKREEAMKTLFGDRALLPNNENSFAPILPQQVLASPSIAKPPKIVYDEVSLIPKVEEQVQATAKTENLRTIPIIAEKNLVPVNSSQGIINGYEFSKQLEEQLGVKPEVKTVSVPVRGEVTKSANSPRVEIENVPLSHRPAATSVLGKSVPYSLLNDYPIDTYDNTSAKTTKAYDMSTITSHSASQAAPSVSAPQPIIPPTIASQPVTHIPAEPVVAREPSVKTFPQPKPVIREEKLEEVCEETEEKFSKIDDFEDEKFEAKVETVPSAEEEEIRQVITHQEEKEEPRSILDKLNFDVSSSGHKTGFAIEEEVEFRPEFLKKVLKEETDFITNDKLDIETIEEEEDLVLDFSETSFDPYEDHTGHYVEAKTENPFKGLSKRRNKTVPTIQLPDQVSLFQPEKELVRRKKTVSKYIPPLTEFLVNQHAHQQEISPEEIQRKAQIIEDTLQDFKVPAVVKNITKGPAVTRYELEISPGFPVKRVAQFIKDIEYNLASNGKIRMETPIPGKRAVGVEVPNDNIDIVGLRNIIESKEFEKASSPLTIALGAEIGGTNALCALDKMPHLLIAGTTGSGKSACLNSIIVSILYKSTPDDVRLILVDPKLVEFTTYRDMPHLLCGDIITDPKQVLNAFSWLKQEMERRYLLFSKNGVRNLAEYNKEVSRTDGALKVPYIVLIVDELADLMQSSFKKDLEDKIVSIAQKARAAGIHLILATQRPSVDVITGTIRTNLPSRIAFSVKSNLDSRIILDYGGAETLLGRGDMLFAPLGSNDPKRVQGAYIDDVATIVNFVKENNECDFDEDFKDALKVKEAEKEVEISSPSEDDQDPLLLKATKMVIESGKASTSFLQRRFGIGYSRAARIMDEMEQLGFIGALEGSKPREIRITMEQFSEEFGEIED